MVGADALVVPAAVGASLIKQLASCNKTTRDKALRLLLNTWLPSQHQASDEDMKKVWKGLFYCVWHADKAPVQADLINRLSSLLLTLPHLPLSIHYLSVFFLTMRREWSGIDSLRLDKFYLLIRRFLHCFFLLLKKNSWDSDLTHRLMGILEDNTFCADDKFKFLGNGVNYHIASIFLEELKPFLPVKVETLDIVFKPFFSMMGKSRDKVLLGKIKSNVFDVLSKMGNSLLERKKLVDYVGDDWDETVNFGTIALMMGFSTKFFDLGSSPDCFQWNRKILFSLHEEFLKLEKDLELSSIEISIPIPKVDDEDEVPKLIPIVSSDTEVGTSGVLVEAAEVAPEGVSMSASKFSKKKKTKVKKGSDGKRKMKKNCTSFKNENENGNMIIANGGSSSNGPTSDGNNILTFNESVTSNLQMQFEKVAAEVGLDKDETSSCDVAKITFKGTISKKRKRARSMDGRKSHNPDLSGQGDASAASAKSSETSAKKVRFSMKNNLVWKPQSPLPPQSLRLPPSVTPRGSALKKGIPPGPIREMPPTTKMLKQKKKGRKGIKTISHAKKRLRKLQTLSI